MRPSSRPMLILLLLCLRQGCPCRGLSVEAVERRRSSGVKDARSRSSDRRYPYVNSVRNEGDLEPAVIGGSEQAGKNAHVSRRRRRLVDEDPAATPTRPVNWLLDSQDEIVRHSRFAYVAVLLGDNDIGMRTLGQSLVDSGTVADSVALLGPLVSAQTEARIRAQGWVVRRLEVGDGVEEHAKEHVVVCSGGSVCVTEVRNNVIMMLCMSCKHDCFTNGDQLIILRDDTMTREGYSSTIAECLYIMCLGRVCMGLIVVGMMHMC